MLSRYSHVRLFATPWTVARQAPLSMGFSRQDYWSGLPCPPPGDLPNPGIKPTSFMPPALAGGFFTTSATWEAPLVWYPFLDLIDSSFLFLPWTLSGSITSPCLTVSSLSSYCKEVQFSHVWLCDPMECSTPGFPVHYQLPEFTQTHVHWVGNVIQPSHPLLSPSPPAFSLSQHQGLFQWVSSSHHGQNIGASASVLPMNIQDWLPLGLSGLISLQSKGLSRVSSNTTVQKHQFFSAQLSL